MSTSTFSGPVVSQGGFITGSAAYLAPITAATATVDPTTQNGAVVPLSRAAGITVTLPAATGSQAVYTFIVTTTFTGNGIIKVANATDVMNGSASISSAGTPLVVSTLPTSDTITMNGTTTGGLVGSYVEVIDIAPGYWITRAELIASGIAATPFSATV